MWHLLLVLPLLMFGLVSIVLGVLAMINPQVRVMIWHDLTHSHTWTHVAATNTEGAYRMCNGCGLRQIPKADRKGRWTWVDAP